MNTNEHFMTENEEHSRYRPTVSDLDLQERATGGAGRILHRGPEDQIDTRILQTTVSGIPLSGALEREGGILMFTWSFGVLF